MALLDKDSIFYEIDKIEEEEKQKESASTTETSIVETVDEQPIVETVDEQPIVETVDSEPIDKDNIFYEIDKIDETAPREQQLTLEQAEEGKISKAQYANNNAVMDKIRQFDKSYYGEEGGQKPDQTNEEYFEIFNF